MSDEQERDAAVAEIRKQVLARPGASKIPAEIDALKFGDSPLTPEQRKILADMPQALTPMNMHQKMAEANAEIDRLTAERDAARAELAKLRERLTKIADENETIYRDHTSVGNDADDTWAAAWGAAGRELRVALGESEVTDGA